MGLWFSSAGRDGQSPGAHTCIDHWRLEVVDLSDESHEQVAQAQIWLCDLAQLKTHFVRPPGLGT